MNTKNFPVVSFALNSILLSLVLAYVFISHMLSTGKTSAPINEFGVKLYAQDDQFDVLIINSVFDPISISKVGGKSKIRISILSGKDVPQNLVAQIGVSRTGLEELSLGSFNRIVNIPLVPGEISSGETDLISTSPDNTFTGDVAFRVSFIDIGKQREDGKFESFTGGVKPHNVRIYPEEGKLIWLSIQSTYPRPQITSVSTDRVPSGIQLTITGMNFDDYQGDSTLSLDGVNMHVNSWSDTKIVGISPPNARIGTLIVVVKNQRSNAVDVITEK
jgi:IPT/TIG domain-containing protein